MSRSYKNIIKLRNKSYGTERRKNLAKEVVKDSALLPKPLEYEDIDKEFNKWVKEDLLITFEGKRLPTFSLFSNQRFSEFLQSWDEVDEKKNLIMNFKTVTRESNPKQGTIFGNTRNIPGDHMILLKRVEAYDKANRKYYIDYKTKQPFSIDLVYTVSIVTNKYELLNEFNILINEKFKAIDCYIRPNGHFIPMKLNDISDESEYNIDNRIYYSQSFSITVMAYIMPKDSFVIEEIPEMKFIGFEGENRQSYAEIQEIDCRKDIEYDYVPLNLKIYFGVCSNNYKFTIDTYFHAKKITTNNIRYFKIYVNDVETELNENFEIKPNDIIRLTNVVKYKTFEEAEIFIEGFNYKERYAVENGVDIKEIIIQ